MIGSMAPSGASSDPDKGLLEDSVGLVVNVRREYRGLEVRGRVEREGMRE